MKQEKPGGVGRLVSLDAAAELLGVSTWTVRRLIDGGAVPVVKMAGRTGSSLRRILIDRADLEAFICRSKEFS